LRRAGNVTRPERGRRRIVFVEQFYYPEGWGGAELPRDVTTHLARRGYAVEVICGSDLYAPLNGDPGPDPAAAGVRIRRIPRLFGGDIHRLKLVRQLWFYAGLLPRLLLGGPADVYVAQTNPPLTVPIVALAARLRRRPLIVVAMDIYPDVIVAHGALAEDAVDVGLHRGWGKHQQLGATPTFGVVELLDQDDAPHGSARARRRSVPHSTVPCTRTRRPRATRSRMRAASRTNNALPVQPPAPGAAVNVRSKGS
jgi:hypothetical protein